VLELLGDSTSSFEGPLVVVSTAVNGMVAGEAIGTWNVDVERRVAACTFEWGRSLGLSRYDVNKLTGRMRQLPFYQNRL
jgi:hypothetical protein